MLTKQFLDFFFSLSYAEKYFIGFERIRAFTENATEDLDAKNQ